MRPHTPAPLRCRDCFKYGVHERNCQGGKKCANCGTNFHGDNCDRKPHCLGCGGRHSVLSSDCPVWKKELAVKSMILRSKIPPAQARQDYDSQFPVVKKTPFPSQQNPPSTNEAPTHQPRMSYADAIGHPENAVQSCLIANQTQLPQPDLASAFRRLEEKIAQQNSILSQLVLQQAEIISLLKSSNNPATPQTRRRRKPSADLPHTPSGKKQQLIHSAFSAASATTPKNPQSPSKEEPQTEAAVMTDTQTPQNPKEQNLPLQAPDPPVT